MRVVVVGATGNLGTSVLEALSAEPGIDEIVAVARRAASLRFPKTEYRTADIVRDDLVPVLRGADAVVHLAWLIQPSRDQARLHAVNVDGSARLFGAAAEARVKAIVYASSVGAYSPGPKDRACDETWPTDGIPSSYYSRHKAAVERILDRVESEQPGIRIVRMRPGLVFKAHAAVEIRRLFMGRLFPRAIVRHRWVPVVPEVPQLRFQAVHSLDVGDAFRRALLSDARGAFNLAADPVLGPAELAEVMHARRLRLPAPALRAGAALTYHLRLQPSEPGWVDMALQVPVMDTGRARRDLGWEPRHSSLEALRELLDGIGAGTDYPTAPLAATPADAL
jgi:nucleoside-diphosphate-sugar epimerase